MPKNTLTPNILILEGLWNDTEDVVYAAGGNPEEVQPWDFDQVHTALTYGNYDGMILTGGSDINPALYGEKPHEETYGIDTTRDHVELMALGVAARLKIPVLGICRGSQIMAAFRGGKLTQHIEEHRGSRHWVAAAPDANTFRRACNGREMPVISLHHQCVRRPGRGMRIAAYCADGTPEAIESKDGLWLGVQFHPEVNAFEQPSSFAIFRWLVQRAAERAGGRAPQRRFRNARENSKRSYRDAYDQAWKDDRLESGYSPSAGTYLLPPAGETTTGNYTQPWREASESETEAARATRASRKAGEPSLPSARAMVQVIESDGHYDLQAGEIIAGSLIETNSCELQCCPECGMLFDHRDDRDDHVRFLHGRPDYPFDTGMHQLVAEYAKPKNPEPPPGDPAWEAVEPTDAELEIIEEIEQQLRGHEDRTDGYNGLH